MQNFLLSVNAVGPILLLVLLGTFLRKKGAIDEDVYKRQILLNIPLRAHGLFALLGMAFAFTQRPKQAD